MMLFGWLCSMLYTLETGSSVSDRNGTETEVLSFD
jgi:hypothetical protein